MTEFSLSPEQVRAARAMLGWSQKDLAGKAGVASQTLADFERGARVPYARTLADIEAALESGGVIFMAEDDAGGAGVRLAKVKAKGRKKAR